MRQKKKKKRGVDYNAEIPFEKKPAAGRWLVLVYMDVDGVLEWTFRVQVQLQSWGRNSSVGSAWARCPRRRGFDPPLGTFSVEGIFPLELTWVQTPFPPKLLRMRV